MPERSTSTLTSGTLSLAEQPVPISGVAVSDDSCTCSARLQRRQVAYARADLYELWRDSVDYWEPRRERALIAHVTRLGLHASERHLDALAMHLATRDAADTASLAGNANEINELLRSPSMYGMLPQCNNTPSLVDGASQTDTIAEDVVPKWHAVVPQENATLAVALREQALAADNYLRYMRQIMCGVAHIHSKQVVHRDLKVRYANVHIRINAAVLQLENILCIDTNKVIITDFGFARHLRPGERVRGATSLRQK